MGSLAAGYRPPRVSGSSPTLNELFVYMQSWFPFIPESASTISGDVDAVYFYVTGVTIFFCTLIWLVIFFFVVRYRRRNAFEIPRPIEGSHKLETLWSVIPLVIAMSIFA